MKKAFSTLPLLSTLLAGTAIAQPVGLDALHQSRGYCAAQRPAVEKARCFEKLADDAIAFAKEAQGAAAKAETAAQAAREAARKPQDPNGEYAQLVRTAKDIITKDFKDPQSTQWRGLFISQGPDAVFLCGALNAKNSYGAYVGFKNFYATEANVKDKSNLVHVVDDDPDVSDLRELRLDIMNQLWEKNCSKRIAGAH